MSVQRTPTETELLGLAAELAPTGILAIDGEGRILLVNREVERLFGYAREELLGRSIDLLVPTRYRDQHPGSRDTYMQGPEARRMGVGRDLYGVRKDGSEVPVEVGLNPIDTQRGKVVLATVVDISARKRAEQRFQAAFESCPSGMIMTDDSGRILLVNRETERLFGYRRDELIGQLVDVLVPERYRGHHPEHRTRYLEHPDARPMGAGRELYGSRKDGSEVAIEIGLNPVRTDEGMFVLSSIVDVTARRRIEAHLGQSQKLEAIGTLASGIAHDFNNLLLGIVGYTDLAARAQEATAQQRDDLEQVLKAAERGRQLVQRILSFSHQRGVEAAAVDLIAMTSETLGFLRASLPTTIEMREIIDPETPRVLADETQVQQVLMNLATNAAHAMPTGGVLEVRVAQCVVDANGAAQRPGLKEGRYAHLSVQDSGTGMTEDVKKRVFEPFFTTKPVGRGTGLGLSVVHGIVRAHGGFIELTSVLGIGTRFDVYLPAVSSSSSDKEEVPNIEEDRRHILLVEDEVPIARMVERQLGLEGYRVTTFTSSSEALRDFETNAGRYDLLVTDNTMPVMTGLALTAEILRLRPELPVLLVSGLAESVSVAELKARGIRAVLGKPHTASQLYEQVRALIGPALRA
jgi:PAS domain S-box-containing protein